MSSLQDKKQSLLDRLATVWAQFQKLGVSSTDETDEFRNAIVALQLRIMEWSNRPTAPERKGEAMTVEEARTKRRDLEASLARQLLEFTAETGLDVRKLRLRTFSPATPGPEHAGRGYGYRIHAVVELG